MQTGKYARKKIAIKLASKGMPYNKTKVFIESGKNRWQKADILGLS